jgi:hypothetical protein|eukprot:CAMPEP_0181211992 /NCGR_PEP_ID=MMETSP1096-20121128/24099_1 /TAXON_ID=156174 ORGANISM="Chrysochromulina ericina, Strain CCMP281" /NCGR_SAMPLE_ID=MMETSP1096 /ASSEMBLY_ACC=CAM_ASM_000453 /LENGTH=245 /DNA_ID=CAMNT_0023303465 /DNA_START=200 /DNA_END=937 /DNA_ORIENTATION=+
MDLLQLSGMKNVPLRAMCGLKVSAVLHGWRSALLPEEVIMLDADIVVLNPIQLLRMFAPLSHYDAAGVMEGYSRGWDGSDTSRRDDSIAQAPDPAGGGWEVNTGVLAIRRQAEWFVQLWAAEFHARLAVYSKLTGVDQSAFMWVLAHEPRARLFAMPPLYNFRGPALYSHDLEPPAAFHSRAAMREPQRDRYSKAMQRVLRSTSEELGFKIASVARSKSDPAVAIPQHARTPSASMRAAHVRKVV